MAITSFTIGGVEVNPLFDHFDVRETEGNVSTLACGIVSSADDELSFSVREPIIVEEDGARIFAGRITQALVSGYGGPNIYELPGDVPLVLWTLTAEDYTRIAEKVYVTETVAAGTTLKTFLTTIAGYMSSHGVTVHASQVNGPALPDLEYTRTRAADILQKLSDATNYLWRIDYDKKLRMWLPGELVAPFDVSESDSPARWTDDVEVETILGDEFANRVTVVVGPINAENRVETFVGDGVTSTFDLTYQLTSFPYGLIHRFESDGVTVDGGETFGLVGTSPAQWTYDPSTNQITRDAGVTDGTKVYKLTFNGYLYLTGVAEDAADILANGLEAHEEQRDDLLTQADVDAMAAEILAQRLLAAEQIARYNTRYPASTLRAGQEQTITAPARGASGAYIISDLEVRAETPVTDDYVDAGLGFIRKVTAKKNPKVGKFQHTYEDWLKVGRGGNAAVAATPIAVGTGPAPPITSVQFHAASGAFGGNEEFHYYDGTGSVVCGPGSEITAASHEGCAIFGPNNFITD
jgi:hypothetical protein